MKVLVQKFVNSYTTTLIMPCWLADRSFFYIEYVIIFHLMCVAGCGLFAVVGGRCWFGQSLEI